MHLIPISPLEAKGELYLTFAEFYKEPTPEFFEEVHQGMTEAWMKEKMYEGGYPTHEFHLKDHFSSYEEMKVAYDRSFRGIVKPYAPPIESVYKEWTLDPTVELQIARSKGYLLGDSALHMRYLYKLARIEIPENYSGMPDHLSLILEFLSLLFKEKEEQLWKGFISDHLDWLGEFEKALQSIEAPYFYREVTSLLRHCIEAESNASNLH
ncbi:TorD/DmsD family molecular chaperone [Thermicanus aegyptius]|uniref:TorD/DmsD family molecular chaperone n=1 Tax=Thermicanus aegyptius TaxID=94009 RepID=UPI00041BCAEC|nr:molecular chaperone TorD family protein [Thermicanus aegyptius]